MTDDVNKDQNKYKINQPETSFPMRGDLAKREPAWLKQWQDKKLYQRIREEQKFESLDALKAQIAQDIAVARAYFNKQDVKT